MLILLFSQLDFPAKPKGQLQKENDEKFMKFMKEQKEKGQCYVPMGYISLCFLFSFVRSLFVKGANSIFLYPGVDKSNGIVDSMC